MERLNVPQCHSSLPPRHPPTCGRTRSARPRPSGRVGRARSLTDGLVIHCPRIKSTRHPGAGVARRVTPWYWMAGSPKPSARCRRHSQRRRRLREPAARSRAWTEQPTHRASRATIATRREVHSCTIQHRAGPQPPKPRYSDAAVCAALPDEDSQTERRLGCLPHVLDPRAAGREIGCCVPPWSGSSAPRTRGVG